jgi:pimeloyl-ACP methyl ester carboxylesterase
VHPFYFGESDRRLFGVYHPARGMSPRDLGVVLCHPMGHEYTRSYRVLRNLAVALAEQGLHVLRFDYYASGDSAGETAERSVGQWIVDVGTAIDELKDTAGGARVSLVGIRFGATLAAFAAEHRDDIDHLILCDPVATGRRYLEEMRIVQDLWFRTRPGPKDAAGRDLRNELLGFPLPAPFVEEVSQIDMSTIRRWPRYLTVLASSQHTMDDSTSLGEHLRAHAVPFTQRQIPGGGDWNEPSSVNRVLLAH